MSIQDKFNELREATENAKAMVDGLKGLGEHIFPQHKLNDRVDDAMKTHYNILASMHDAQAINNREVVERCEQMTNEVTQLANSITARYEDRLKAIEAKLERIYDIFEGMVEIADRRTLHR